MPKASLWLLPSNIVSPGPGPPKRFLERDPRANLRQFYPAQPVIDAILATSLIVHSHIGFDSCIIDYLHERKMPVIGFAAKWLLRVATGASIWGVYEFETNDIGKSMSRSTDLRFLS